MALQPPPLYPPMKAHKLAYRGDANTLRRELQLNPESAHTFDHFGFQPLHQACERNHVDAALCLLEHGSDITAKTTSGLTPLDVASQNHKIEVIDAILEFAQRHKIDPKRLSTRSLHNAALKASPPLIQRLLQAGLDANATLDDGCAPLHYLATSSMRNTSCILDSLSMLLDAGAHLDAKNTFGETPLHNCIKSGPSALFYALIKNGADWNIRNQDSISPIDLIRHLHRADLLDFVETVEEREKLKRSSRSHNQRPEEGVGL